MSEDMRDYQAMRGNPQQMSEAEELQQMADEMAECGNCENNTSCAAGGLCIVTEIIYHEVDGQIVPLRVAEPGEIAATEAASGLS